VLPVPSLPNHKFRPTCNQLATSCNPVYQVNCRARLQVWPCFTNRIGVPRGVWTHNLSTKLFPRKGPRGTKNARWDAIGETTFLCFGRRPTGSMTPPARGLRDGRPRTGLTDSTRLGPVRLRAARSVTPQRSGREATAPGPAFPARAVAGRHAHRGQRMHGGHYGWTTHVRRHRGWPPQRSPLCACCAE
jgi:hypothetical protein